MLTIFLVLQSSRCFTLGSVYVFLHYAVKAVGGGGLQFLVGLVLVFHFCL